MHVMKSLLVTRSGNLIGDLVRYVWLLCVHVSVIAIVYRFYRYIPSVDTTLTLPYWATVGAITYITGWFSGKRFVVEIGFFMVAAAAVCSTATAGDPPAITVLIAAAFLTLAVLMDVNSNR